MDTHLPSTPSSDGERVQFPEKPARHRRWRKVLITLGAVIVLSGATAAGAFFGVKHEDNHWKPIYHQAVTEEAHWKSSSQQFHLELQDLQGKVSAAVGNLDSPHFTLWNSCSAAGSSAGCPLTPGYEYVGGVPDTFTYSVSFASTVPVTVWIMSTSNFVCWETHYCAWRGVGWQDQTNLLDGVFHDAEGCAGYIAVFFSKQAGTLYPDVSITRNPAAQPTGTCA
jgi:hypothetical protein